MLIDTNILKQLSNNDAILKDLILHRQGLTDIDILKLCQALEGNTNLESLSLYENKIGAEGAKALALNKTLTTLNLRYNPISMKEQRR